MENELDFWIFTDSQGTITVSVVPDNGNKLIIPAGTPPIERDNRINAFKAEQQALAGSS